MIHDIHTGLECYVVAIDIGDLEHVFNNRVVYPYLSFYQTQYTDPYKIIWNVVLEYICYAVSYNLHSFISYLKDFDYDLLGSPAIFDSNLEMRDALAGNIIAAGILIYNEMNLQKYIALGYQYELYKYSAGTLLIKLTPEY